MNSHAFACCARGLFALVACMGSAAAAVAPGALVNARIHTLDPARPLANAMRWDAQGRIVALGTETERLALAGVDAIDAGGRSVVPGLIDAHGHLMGLGFALLRADLVGARSKAEVIERLQMFARDLPDDAWLLGRGWDQNDWPEKSFPTRSDLDAAFPDRPVWLERIDGHAGWANSAAISAADRPLDGVWQPEGGRIERVDGRASGVFIDAAMSLIESVVPTPDEALREHALQRALGEAVKFGLTGVHDAGVSLSDLALYRRFADAGRLPLRITAMADGDNAALAALCAMGPYTHPNGRLQMRTVKLYIDGALGSRGAVLLADYSDDPGNRGLFVTPPDALDRAVDTAWNCGVQVAAHAIGDAGNRRVLDSFARHLPKADATRQDLRWRIEHAQIVALDDIPRFAAMGVIASMQPTHATSDMPWAEDRVGAQRIRGGYAWRRMLDAGVRLALGSDFPVESVNPLLGLHAAVTRQDGEGKPRGGWKPDQRLSAFEALRGFTLDAAYAGFAESEIGSLAPGKRADFVVLSDDVLGIAPAKLASVRVLATHVDGEAVFRATD